MNIKAFIATHRLLSAVVGIVTIWFVWHLTFGAPVAMATRYVVGTAQTGTLVVSVTGTGQVAASNQVDVKAKVGGDVTAVRVAQGQTVKVGTVLAQVDATDAARAVRDAQNALDSAKVTLQQLQATQTSDTPKLTGDLSNAYQDAFSDIATAFLSLPTLATDTHGILYDNTLGGSCSPNLCQYSNLISASSSYAFAALKATAITAEQSAQNAYTPTFNAYKAADTTSTPATISALLDQSLGSAQLMLQAVKGEQNMLDELVADLTQQSLIHGNNRVTIPSQITTYQSLVATDIGKLNSMITTLRGQQRTIANAQQAIGDAAVQNPLDVQAQQNTVIQRANTLSDAQQTLANATIRAPFDGVIAKVSVKQGDTISSGTAIATIVTHTQIATLTLNEVDAAKVAVGQAATLTFDAVPDLTIAGAVATVDTVGTVSQGVVTYTVTIAFATQDVRVKPGMSTSASIITQAVTDALLVPTSAVKAQGTQSYVLVVDGTLPATATTTGFVPTAAPRMVTVQTGAANDTQTQVTSGITDGTNVVVRTVTTATSAGTTAPSLLNAAGVRGAGGSNATFTRTTIGGSTTGR